MEEKIVFLPNYNRIIDIVCLLAQKQKSDEPLGIHKTMKLLFFADVEHINKHYVPITGGRYLAMRFGPVHKEAYDIINGNSINLPDVGNVPFARKDNHIIITRSSNDLHKHLSKDHITIIESIWDKYGKKDFIELTELSHQHPAWQDAWGNRINDAPEIDYEKFFEKVIDNEIINELRESARFITL